MEASREEILKALEQVIDPELKRSVVELDVTNHVQLADVTNHVQLDPELKRSVVELDMVRDVRVDGDDVTVGIALTVAGCPLRASFEEQVAKALAPVAGVERVSLEFG